MATLLGRTAIICATLAAAGCSSSSGTGVTEGSGVVVTPGLASATTFRAANGAMMGRAEDLARTTDLPVSGTASYSGYLDLSVTPLSVEAFRVLMTADLMADFDASTLSGSFSDPVLTDGNPINGGGQMVGGALSGADITGMIEADLTRDGTDFGIDGTLTGEFRGSGGAMIAGDIAGTLDPAAGTSGTFSGHLTAQN